MNWLFRDPPRDPQLGEALRQLETVSRVDDAQLRQRIVTAAAPQLASLRSPSPRWWEWISRWMPIAVPVGLAASFAAGLLLPGAEQAASAVSYASEAGADSALVIAAFSEVSVGGELTGYLVSPEGGDWLLEEAVSQ